MILILTILQIGLGSPRVFMPKLNGLKQNVSSVFEVCLCSDGSMFAADITQGCFDSARQFGHCPSS